MIKYLGLFLGNLFGLGKSALEHKQKLKEAKRTSEIKIVEARTTAELNRIYSETKSDHDIDLITAQNKRYTSKDEVVTYLFLVPVIIATLVPFFVAIQTKDLTQLNELVKQSYLSLDQLPKWYKYVLGAIVIDVLGFRSFARKLVDKYFKS